MKTKKTSRKLRSATFGIKKYVDKDIRVGDRCHITAKYRGSSHQNCNLNFQLIDKIPVIFHKLRGHDNHFTM